MPRRLSGGAVWLIPCAPAPALLPPKQALRGAAAVEELTHSLSILVSSPSVVLTQARAGPLLGACAALGAGRLRRLARCLLQARRARRGVVPTRLLLPCASFSLSISAAQEMGKVFATQGKLFEGFMQATEFDK